MFDEAVLPTARLRPLRRGPDLFSVDDLIGSSVFFKSGWRMSSIDVQKFLICE